MIPLRDTIASEKTPLVTWTLMAICVVVYVCQFALGLQKTQYNESVPIRGRMYSVSLTRNDVLVQQWGAIPAAVVKGYIPIERRERGLWGQVVVNQSRREVSLTGRFLPLLTSLFLHGSIFHLISNMIFLYVFGDNVEDRLGHFTFLLFYLGGGVFASLTHIMTNISSPVPIIGASGAISAVLGAYFLLFPRAWVVTFVPLFIVPIFFKVPAILFIGFWFVGQFISGMDVLFDPKGVSVAWWAHIGGFVFGLILVFWNYPRWRKKKPRFSDAQVI